MNTADMPPPVGGEGPRCPFCHSTETELLSLFGSQLLTEQYYCRTCRTPFEHIKDSPEDGVQSSAGVGRVSPEPR